MYLAVHMLARADTPLKQILADEGRTQVWLARRIGASADQVNRWVHGVHVPVDATKIAIADTLGRSVESLWPAHDAEVSATNIPAPANHVGEDAR